jgi:hypothetical protein
MIQGVEREKDDLPDQMHTKHRAEIEKAINETSPNFLRLLNKNLPPVIQNANIASLRAISSIVLITGIPYSRDNYWLFLILVYLVFNVLEHNPIRIIKLISWHTIAQYWNNATLQL